MKKLIYSIIFLASFALPSCSDDSEPKGNADYKEIELSARERSASSAFNSFGDDFFKAICASDVEHDNIVVSPLSAQYFLGMLANGSDETGRRQIASVLGCEDVDAINTLSSKLQSALPLADAKVKLATANALWYQNTLSLKPDFKSALTTAYDAGVFEANFASNASKVSSDICGWVKRATSGMIGDYKPFITGSESAVLVNALYFKGQWEKPFYKGATKQKPFHGIHGDVDVQMMYTSRYMAYTETESYEGARIKFGNGAFSATFILPYEGTDVNDIPALTDMTWNTYTVNLSLPRVDIAYENTDIHNVFSSLGIDASGRHQKFFEQDIPSYLSVMQKARIIFNEEGAEAAAVTSSHLPTSPGPDPNTKIVNLDRPFLFYITEQSTGTILFAGYIRQL